MNTALATVPAPSALLPRAAFLAALETAALVTEKRNPYPILANVRLRGDGGALFVTGTDLDIVIDVRVDGAADSTFDVTLPALLLKQMVKGAPKEVEYVAMTAPEWPAPVNGTRPTAQALVDVEAIKSSVESIHPAAWPTLKVAPFTHRFTIGGAELFGLIDSTAFAISNEETRYYLNGTYMHAGKLYGYDAPMFRAVATDGHRMARAEMEAPAGADGMPGIIVPKKTVAILQRLLKGKRCPASVEVEVSDTKVRFQFGAVTILSKLIEGFFPEYERVTPKNNDKRVTVASLAFVDALKAVSAIASERGGKAVKLTIKDGEITMTVTNPDAGAAERTIPATVDFDPGPYGFEIGFNIRYLNDILSNVGPEAELAFNDAGSPTLIREPGESAALFVLMPVRV